MRELRNRHVVRQHHHLFLTGRLAGRGGRLGPRGRTPLASRLHNKNVQMKCLIGGTSISTSRLPMSEN